MYLQQGCFCGEHLNMQEFICASAVREFRNCAGFMHALACDSMY